LHDGIGDTFGSIEASGLSEPPRKESLMVKHSLVSAVDDDESVRESLRNLLRMFGCTVQVFSSAEEFLASDSG
jgi:PleD family two-component response regulator